MQHRADEGGPRRYPAVDRALGQIFGPESPAPLPYDVRALPVVRPSATRRWPIRAILAGLALASIGGVAMGLKSFEGTTAPATTIVKQVPVADKPRVEPVDRPVAQLAIAPTRPVEIAPVAVEPAPTATPSLRATPRERLAAPVVAEAPARRSGECARYRGSAQIACLADRLDDADQDLVDAYGAAADRGVGTARLTMLNRRWTRAREIARNDPATALTMYHRIAGELWAANPDD